MTRGPARLDVSVGYALPRAGLPAAVSFRRWVTAALSGRIREADLAVRLVDEAEGRALNRHYRGKDYATNVLSFPADIAEGVKLPKGVKMPLLGDLVLCAPVVVREGGVTTSSPTAEKSLNEPCRPMVPVTSPIGW